MPTRIKSSQILDGSIVASDLHPAIAVNTTAAGTFGSVIVDTITIDAAAIATSGDLTLDSAGDITLNADGADIILADDTVDFGRFKRDGGDFVIKAETADKDIIFKGVKAGSPDTVITALSLDMSNDGRATFNENIVAGGTITGVTTLTSSGVISTSNTTGSTNTTSGALTVAGGIGVAENAYIGGNVIVTGNLTVEGTQVTLNTSALDVEDKNITLNYHASNDTSASADGAGITIQDAVDASNDASILWDAGNDEFDISHSMKIAGSVGVTNIVTNKVVKFNGTILDDSNITDTGSLITLGSNTTASANLSIGGATATTAILSIPGADTTTKPQIRFISGIGTTLADAAISTTDDSGGTNLLIGSNQYYSAGAIARFDTSRSGSAIDFGYTGNMKFYTGTGADAPTEKMRIASDGALILNNAGGDAQMYFGGTSGTNRMYLARSGGDSLLWNVSNGVMMFGTNDAERMRITSTGEIVTGGLTSSTGQLHLYKADATGGKLVLQSQVESDATAKITMMSRLLDNSNKDAYIEAYRGNINFGGDAGYGNVGIGTNIPGAKLDVSADALINNVKVGRGPGDVTSNTVVGAYALATNTTGSSNTAIGNWALNKNLTAQGNTAVGKDAAYNTSTGNLNTAVGSAALYSNVSGSNITAIGNGALRNTTSSNNTGLGYQAGYNNTAGSGNVYVGNRAGHTATGNSNVIVNGTGSTTANSGSGNVFIGNSTGNLNSTGSANTFVGAYVYNVGSAGSLMTTGSKNTILGAFSGNQGGLDIRTADNFIVLSDGDGNPRQVIDSSGNVGIGTSSPSYKLDVNGIIRSENSSEVGTLYLGNTAQSQIPGGAIIGQRSTNYSSTGNLLFQVPTWGVGTDYGLTTQMSIEVSGADTKEATISMIPFGGKVGIGTDAPQTSLHLSKAITGPIIRLQNSTNGIGENILLGGIEWFNTDSSGEGPNVVSAIESYSGSSSGNDGYLTFSTYNSLESDSEGQRASEKMRLTTDGKVGIGDDSPDAMLHVKTTSTVSSDPTVIIEAPIYPNLRFNSTNTNANNRNWNFSSVYNSYGTFEILSSTEQNGVPSATRLSIKGTDGNVGIGTFAPAHRLDVTGGTIGVDQVRHSIRPSLNLDFANSKELDSRITFYRDSIATYYDSKGVLKYAKVNEPRFDHDPATGESKGLLIEEARTNIAIASTLELPLDFNGMYTDKFREVAPDGTYSGHHILASSGVSRHEVNIKYAGTATVVYTASTYIKPLGAVTWISLSRAGGSDMIGFDLINITTNTPGGTASGTISDAGNGWRKITFTFTETTTDSSRSVYISPGIGTPSSSVYYNLNGDGENGVAIWGSQLEAGSFATSYIPPDTTFTSRASNATYHDETGILRTAPVNGARHGYKYDGRKWVETGLILEAAATNLYSTNTGTETIASTTGSCTLTNNYATAPDGSTTAERFVWNSGYGYRYWPNVHGNGVVHTHSYYIKPISGTTDTRHQIGGTPGVATWTLNFDNQIMEQVAGNGTTYGYTFEKLADGWWRVSVTFSLPNSTGYVEVQWAGSGSGVEYYLWGMQVETGYITSSFIYAPNAATTRAADVASSVAYTRQAEQAVISGNNFSDWYNTDYGTLFSESKAMKTNYWSSAVLLTNDEVAGSSSTGRDFIEHIYYTSNTALAGAEVVTEGATVDDGWMTVDRAQYAKIANAFAEDNFASSANGSVATTDTSGLVPRKINAMYIGAFYVNYDPFCGHIKKISYYPERLTNAELQALTENN